MSNPNFVSDLVAMAKAFEELPSVKAELEAAQHDAEVAKQRIQSLELRLIDRANELEAAHTNTRKVEVERDHAEQMFLEADDKLNGIKSFLSNQIGSAQSLFAALEPPKPEPVAEPQAESKFDDGGPYNEPVVQGQGDVDPTTATMAVSSSEIGSGVEAPDTSASSAESTSTEPQAGVSVPSDPTPVTETSSEKDFSGWAVQLPEPTQAVGAPQERPTDPTAAATPIATPTDAISTGADVSDVASASTTTEQPGTSSSASVADVGYHNEPKIAAGGGAEAWAEWDLWCLRMNAAFPTGWPQRPQAAQ